MGNIKELNCNLMYWPGKLT